MPMPEFHLNVRFPMIFSNISYSATYNPVFFPSNDVYY